MEGEEAAGKGGAGDEGCEVGGEGFGRDGSLLMFFVVRLVRLLIVGV